MIQTVSCPNPSPLVVMKLRIGDESVLKRTDPGNDGYQLVDMDVRPLHFDHMLYHVDARDQLYQTFAWEQDFPAVGKVRLCGVDLINAAGFVAPTREAYTYACQVRFQRQLHMGPEGGLLIVHILPGAHICLDFETI